jgi:hypothetical protein
MDPNLELKEKFLSMLLLISEGIFQCNINNFRRLSVSKEIKNLGLIKENALIFLYRLIFLSYIHLKNQSHGLNCISTPLSYIITEFDQILSDSDKNSHLSGENFEIYEKLTHIFSEVTLIFPLLFFKSNFNEFKSSWHINNRFLFVIVQTILEYTALIFSSTLIKSSIHLLGEIYESTLNYQVIIEKLKVKSGTDPIYTSIRIVTDYNEKYQKRKTLGSFYSSEEIIHPLVNKIIKNQFNFTIEQISLISHQKSPVKFIHSFLTSFKILDPAVGCGFFLLDTIEVLTHLLEQEIQRNFSEEIITSELGVSVSLSDWIKIQIIAQSLYGVDINPIAIELTKLFLIFITLNDNLWSEYHPQLKLLNNHLKTGNALISYRPQFLWNLITQIFPEKKLRENFIIYLQNKQKFEMIDENYPINIFDNISDQNSHFDQNLINLKDKIYDMILASNLPLIQKKSQIINWDLEFPEVLLNSNSGVDRYNTGFDIIFGNPPWGIKFSSEEKSFLANQYPWVNDYESYQYFISRSLDLLKNNGIHGFVVPNTMILNVLTQKFRNYLLSQGGFVEITDFSTFPSFLSAKVRCLTYVFWKNQLDSMTCMLQISKKPTHITKIAAIPQTELKSYLNWGFFFNKSPQISSLLKKIEDQSLQLGEILEIKQGYIPYRKSTLSQRFGQEEAIKIIRERRWHSSCQIDSNYKRELRGKDVDRYHLKWSHLWAKYGKFVSTFIDLRFFQSPRLLFREITHGLPHCLKVMYTEEEFLNNPSLIGAIRKSAYGQYSLYYLLTLANSSLLSYYFINMCPKAQKGLFPKILIRDVKSLPIKRIDFDVNPLNRNMTLENFIANFEEKYRQPNISLDTFNSLFEIIKNQNFVSIHDFLAFLGKKMIETTSEIHDLTINTKFKILNDLIDKIVQILYQVTPEESILLDQLKK